MCLGLYAVHGVPLIMYLTLPDSLFGCSAKDKIGPRQCHMLRGTWPPHLNSSKSSNSTCTVNRHVHFIALHCANKPMMNFASLMSAQIAKSKIPASASPEPTKQTKYLKRSEIEEQRQAAYVAEQKALEEARIAKVEKKRKFDDDEAEKNKVREEKRRRLAEESRKLREDEEEAEERKRRKRLGLPDLPPKAIEGQGVSPAEEENDMEEEELFRKLRDMDEPAKLFGETHANRLRRYRRLAGLDESGAPAAVMTKGPIPTTLVPVPEAEMKVPETVPKDAAGKDFLFRQLASYFTMVLSEWQIALARRDESVKTSYTGKAAYNAMVQAKTSMVPLFRKLEKGELENGILTPVVEIVRCCQERRYVHANDAYLRLSIGKA